MRAAFSAYYIKMWVCNVNCVGCLGGKDSTREKTIGIKPQIKIYHRKELCDITSLKREDFHSLFLIFFAKDSQNLIINKSTPLHPILLFAVIKSTHAWGNRSRVSIWMFAFCLLLKVVVFKRKSCDSLINSPPWAVFFTAFSLSPLQNNLPKMCPVVQSY